jgi:hypothetical protein
MKLIQVDRIARSSVPVLLLIAGMLPIESRAFNVFIDQFQVTRDGAVSFVDNFSDGNPPPSAPNFINNTPAAYTSTLFSGTAESNGLLRLDTSQGVLVTGPTGAPVLTQSATLVSDTTTSTTAGQKRNMDLTLSGLFSLTTLTGPYNSGYGIRFVDNLVNGPNHQQAALSVQYDAATGQNRVAWVFADFDAHTNTTVDSVLLSAPGGADEIQLSLNHVKNTDDITAGYAFYQGGSPMVTGAGTFTTPIQMFQGETYVRSMFFAVETIPEPETYAMLLAGLGLMGWVGRRRMQKAG